jgi:Spy/CpxP family protein refolding chaperone
MHRILPALLPGLLTLSLLFSTPVFAQPQGSNAGPADRGRNLVSRIWWNQSQKVEELKLTTEQRGKMDALLESYLEKRRAGGQEQRKVLETFGRALASGNEVVARQQRDAYAETMTAPLKDQMDMMIAVVSVLTPEQRQELTSRYPKILSRLWIRSGNARNQMNRPPRQRRSP